VNKYLYRDSSKSIANAGQTASVPDLTLLLSGPVMKVNEEQVTKGVRSAERSLQDLAPVSGSGHLSRLRQPLCGHQLITECGGDAKRCCQSLGIMMSGAIESCEAQVSAINPCLLDQPEHWLRKVRETFPHPTWKLICPSGVSLGVSETTSASGQVS
jgi:hypothetical protein